MKFHFQKYLFVGILLIFEGLLFFLLKGIPFSLIITNIFDFWKGLPFDRWLIFHQLIWLAYTIFTIGDYLEHRRKSSLAILAKHTFHNDISQEPDH